MKSRLLLSILACLALLVAGCGGSDSETEADSSGAAAGSTEPRKVAALFPGPIDDSSWNQAGYEGLERAKGEGIETSHTESVAQDQQLEAFRGYAQRGNQVVIAHGGQFMEAALRVAKDFPDTHFVVTNGEKSAANVTSLSFSYPEIGYLAGVLAASRSETGKVGIVAGLELPIIDQAVKGFEAGAKAVDPDVEVKVVITGSFDDVAKAREQSLALISGGVDVLWPILNAAETGVYSAAEDEQKMSIGFYGDVTKLAPTSYIGSPLADPGDLVHAAATDSDLLDGSVHALQVKDGLLDVAPLPEGTPDETRAAVERAIEDLESGKATP